MKNTNIFSRENIWKLNEPIDSSIDGIIPFDKFLNYEKTKLERKRRVDSKNILQIFQGESRYFTVYKLCAV